MSPSSTAAISVGVRYGKRLIFSGVSLDATAGMLTAVIGPNGSGKSSLLRVLAGVQRPSEGLVRRGGRTALVVSSVNPPADVTPRELADYGLALRRPWWRFQPSMADAAAAEAALAKTGMTDRGDDPVTTLSAGEVQRAWIAAALATSADTLLIDEPTSHLDLRYQIEVLRTLRDVARAGIAVVAAIHDITLAARFADRIALLANGHLLAGPPDEILDSKALRDAFDIDVSVHRHPADGYLVCLPR